MNTLLEELKVLYEESSSFDKFYNSVISPLQDKLAKLSEQYNLMIEAAKKSKDDPRIQSQLTKIEQEINKLKELISDNYEKVANNVKEDPTTLQKIQNKIEEFNNYLKDSVGVGIVGSVLITIPTVIGSYLILNRKKIKKYGL